MGEKRRTEMNWFHFISFHFFWSLFSSKHAKVITTTKSSMENSKWKKEDSSYPEINYMYLGRKEKVVDHKITRFSRKLYNSQRTKWRSSLYKVIFFFFILFYFVRWCCRTNETIANRSDNKNEHSYRVEIWNFRPRKSLCESLNPVRITPMNHFTFSCLFFSIHFYKLFYWIGKFLCVL